MWTSPLRAYPVSGGSIAPGSVGEGEELTFLGETLQDVDATVHELEPRSGNEIPDRRRDEDLTGRGLGGDACADVHGDAADLAARKLFDLAGVNAGPHLQPEPRDGTDDGTRGPDRP